jgi:hypothetical protein
MQWSVLNLSIWNMRGRGEEKLSTLAMFTRKICGSEWRKLCERKRKS